MLIRFYYSHIIKIAPPPCGHVFQQTGTNFEIALISSEQMCSPSLKMFYYCHLWKTALPPGCHLFQQPGTIVKLDPDIIKTNILTKLHEYWAKNVTSTGIVKINMLTKLVVEGIVKINILTKLYQAMSHDTKTEPYDDHND
ncbi:hypothetical protein DPMN_042739 [Dreissena polymorpha]|uniref:Uncharacterized protein n=1 Tax=Dreissena polymorpha TaxID=45954 RepID=A0A9D4D1I0_DREPO|nr:hypothetical protein DPMN_042739 [Dreissena polymorpha]